MSRHAKERMAERKVLIRQVMEVMRSSHSQVTEGPAPTPGGSWKFNLLGYAAGDTIELVIDLRECEHNPCAYVVTVIVK